MEGIEPTHPKELIYSQPPLSNLAASPFNFGGGKRDRTDDPLLAKQVLSQLSYTPKLFCIFHVYTSAAFEDIYVTIDA